MHKYGVHQLLQIYITRHYGINRWRTNEIGISTQSTALVIRYDKIGSNHQLIKRSCRTLYMVSWYLLQIYREKKLKQLICHIWHTGVRAKTQINAIKWNCSTIKVQTACHLRIVQSLTKFFYPGIQGMSYQSRKTQIALATANFIVLNQFCTRVRLHIYPV